MTRRKHVPRAPDVCCHCGTLYDGRVAREGHGLDRCPANELRIENERIANIRNLRRQLAALADAEAALERADEAGAIVDNIREIAEEVTSEVRASLAAEEQAQLAAVASCRFGG